MGIQDRQLREREGRREKGREGGREREVVGDEIEMGLQDRRSRWVFKIAPSSVL